MPPLNLALEIVGVFIVSITAVGGVWWRVHSRITNVELALRKDLAEFKLEVAKEYVSTAHLSEVERRLMESINDLSEGIKDLRKEIIALSRNQ